MPPATASALSAPILSSAIEAGQGRAQSLAQLSPEREWLALFQSPHSRRAYATDVHDFFALYGIESMQQLQSMGRTHVLGWRAQLQQGGASPATQRRKLAALASLFRHLGERGVVSHNPVQDVRRPPVTSYEGQTPALSDQQARELLDAPAASSSKGLRDRAILAMLLYQALRRSELCALNIGDLQMHRGQWRLRVQGKGGRLRMLPMHPLALERLRCYFDASAPRGAASPMFVALSNPRGDGRISAQGVYTNVVRKYGEALGLATMPWFGPHVMRTTAATQALEQGADLAAVQHWLGHASIQTTRGYDRREHALMAPTLGLRYG